jgi:CysZ protein
LTGLLSPLARALAQLDDRIFLGVLLRSVAWSAVCFVLLPIATIWAVHHLLDLHGWIGWAADILSGIGASLLALWLFLPVAAIIGTLYIDRIARAVELRYYPNLPPARGASLAAQLWDAISIGLRILLLNLLALILVLILPGVGLVLAWVIGAADALYRRVRPVVLAQGCMIALAGAIPALNLLIPVVGTAAMVHVLDLAMTNRRS